ncbi:hypothetical protein BH09CHL1_BH09CHL1_10840 [soil metagenome]
MKQEATMDRGKALVRKVFAMDERGVTPPQEGTAPRDKRDLLIILTVGMSIVIFGVIVMFFGVFW